jgi:hypothetical protein
MSSKVEEITKGAATVTDPLAAGNAIIKELSGKVDYIKLNELLKKPA